MSLHPVIPLAGDQRKALRAAIRQAIKDGCAWMVQEHQCAPISTICMMAEQSILTAFDIEPEAAYEYFYAILDRASANTDLEAQAAMKRRAAAFETLVQATQLRGLPPKGSA